MIVTL
ncbi:unnamed protein product, partial [Allacma fusca]